MQTDRVHVWGQEEFVSLNSLTLSASKQTFTWLNFQATQIKIRICEFKNKLRNAENELSPVLAQFILSQDLPDWFSDW